jgi:hypothetical protein
MPFIFRILLIIFALLSVVLAVPLFFSANFHPELSAAYTDNLLPRLWESLLAGGAQAFHMLVDLAGKLAHFIASTIAALFAAVADAFQTSSPVANAPVRAPPPPPAPLPLRAPVAPLTASGPSAPGFFGTFFSGFLNGLLLLSGAGTLLYGGGLYFKAYSVRWPAGAALPALGYRDQEAEGLHFILHIAFLIGGIVFLFGSGIAGYAGGIAGFLSGWALVSACLGPRSSRQPVFARQSALPPRIEEGQIIRLSVRHDGVIEAAAFRDAYRTIAAGTELSDLDIPVLALIANALRTLNGLPRDADLLERYLDQRAPDWRQQAEAAAAAEDEQSEAQQPSSGMTRDQALEVLGLKDGATRDDIEAAYKRLIVRNHPDTGGTEFLAKQLNEAREVLLG